jgi:hypothetical protein
MLRAAIYTGAFAQLLATPAAAKEGNNGHHYGWGKGGGVSRGAPGPVVGVGLVPGIVAFGVYVWYRRRHQR